MKLKTGGFPCPGSLHIIIYQAILFTQRKGANSPEKLNPTGPALRVKRDRERAKCRVERFEGLSSFLHLVPETQQLKKNSRE
jgi:hypothetical protein